MWPYFWVKAAAVKMEDAWHLVAFSLSGQWADTKQVVPVDAPRGSLAAISQRLDAATAWRIVKAITTTKTLELAPGIVASVPDVSVSPNVIWQDQGAYIDRIAGDVAEPATWWFLLTGDQRPWLHDPAQLAHVLSAIRPTLQALGETSFEAYISNRFTGQRVPMGGTPSVDYFQYHLDLPLALRLNVQAYDPEDRARRIELDCHAPLQLSRLEVTEGDIPRSRPHARAVERDAASRGGWAIGHVSVALPTHTLRIASPQLSRILSYEFSAPTREEVVAHAVAYLYAPHDAAGKGAARWQQDLMTGTGPSFEVALFNALARFGIPLLFAGQFKTPEGEVGGTASEGFDLLALAYRNQRAVAISAKGSARLPQPEHLDTLRKSVAELSYILPRWMVFGLVACHATHRDFARWNMPTDLNVWGQEELAVVFHASTAQAIAGLLWVPPWASDMERHLYPTPLPRFG
jgi:hypothetical protein